jgi:IS605 OrfB family transposase
MRYIKIIQHSLHGKLFLVIIYSVKLSYNYPNQKQAEKLRSNFSFRKKRLIIEKLNVRSMLEAKGFEINKGNIQDASWARFASLLFYKAERADRMIIEVDPKNTSKMCSGCSNLKDLTLQDRQYHGDACGIAMDQDINAAINIRRLGTSLATDKTISEAHDFSHG